MDEDLKEVFVKSERVFDGALLKVRKDTVALPNGKEAVREWITHPGAAAVVPILDDGRIAMVRQYRYPVDKVTLEVPAGKLDQAEDPEVCVRRELREETGYEAKTIRKVAAILTTPGFSDERIHLYVAEGLAAGKQCPDEDEFIHVVKFTREEIAAMIRSGEIDDAKTMLALLLAGVVVR